MKTGTQTNACVPVHSQKVDKQNVIYTYNGLSLSLKKEGNYYILTQLHLIRSRKQNGEGTASSIKGNLCVGTGEL